MIFDISKIKSQDIPSAFLDLVHTEDVSDIELMLNNPNVKQYLDVPCMFLALISAASLKDLSVFNYIHNYIKEDNIEISNVVLEKMFNSLCMSKSLKNLQILDETFKLSEYMMNNTSSINETAIITGDLLNYYANMYPIYNTRQEELDNSWIIHGLVTASKDGNNELVEYLLSIPVDIPTKLIEACFISATDEFHYDTAMIAYSKLTNIVESEFIKNYAKSVIDEGKAKFVAKLILKEEIETDLSINNNQIKKNKL